MITFVYVIDPSFFAKQPSMAQKVTHKLTLGIITHQEAHFVIGNFKV